MSPFEDVPRLEATITMATFDEGGRATPLDSLPHGRYMPHLRVVGEDTWLGVVILSAVGDAMRPGDPTAVSLGLMYDRVDYSALRPGVAFEVLEGPRVVGTGIVG